MAGREGKGRGGRLHATLSGGRGSVDAEEGKLLFRQHNGIKRGVGRMVLALIVPFVRMGRGREDG